jgi:hypothetical protein
MALDNEQLILDLVGSIRARLLADAGSVSEPSQTKSAERC